MKTTKGLAMLAVLVLVAFAQEKQIKRGLTPGDWKYSLAPGVTTKEITYYSDEVP